MSDTKPTQPVVEPNVTADFLRASQGARFVRDHLELPSGAAVWTAIGAGGVWLLRGSTGWRTYALSLDTYRVLEYGVAHLDGSFHVTGAVRQSDGSVVAKDTVLRLRAVVADDGKHIAVAVPVANEGAPAKASAEPPEPEAMAPSLGTAVGAGLVAAAILGNLAPARDDAEAEAPDDAIHGDHAPAVRHDHETVATAAD